MAKANQVMQIDPQQEIIFKGPFTDVVTSHLVLTNPTDRQLCFKVKTTAPKQYCVRPNSGLIPAKGQVKVAVMLQPFDYNAEEKSKHKFMIQTAFVPDGETSLESIWKNTSGDALMDSKLKVLFEMPEVNNVDKTPLKQTPQKVANVNAGGGNVSVGGGSYGGGGADADLRRYQNENKGLQGKVHQLEAENEQLRARLSRSESSHTSSHRQHVSKDGSSSVVQGLPSEFKILHVAIAALVALFLGLIFGKVF